MHEYPPLAGHNFRRAPTVRSTRDPSVGSTTRHRDLTGGLILYAKCMSEECLAGRLTSDDESEGVVLCDRNAGPHNIHKRHCNQSNRRDPRQDHPKKRVAGTRLPTERKSSFQCIRIFTLHAKKGASFYKDVRKMEQTRLRTCHPDCGALMHIVTARSRCACYSPSFSLTAPDTAN
jgi:hypothetical protein